MVKRLMLPLPDHMRALRAADHDAIDALLHAAFAGPAEARLVRDLRAAGEMEMELVLPDEAGPAGYLAFSRMVAPAGWVALAPVAIARGWQGRGLGQRLVKAALKLATIKGQTVVVLGNPAFYGRCGFSSDRAVRLTSPYPIRSTLIARPGEDVPEGPLVYPAAFGGV